MKTSVRGSVWILLAACLLAGCSGGEPPVPESARQSWRQIAQQFGSALASRDYAAAYALTSKQYRARASLDQMKDGFETIVPPGQAVGPVEVGYTMEDWPDRQPADVGWAYVSVGGDVASEAVTVIVTLEEGQLRIRWLEWGRP